MQTNKQEHQTKQTSMTKTKQEKKKKNENMQTSKEIRRNHANKQTNKQTKSHVTDEGLDCIYRSIGLNYGWHMCQQAKLLKVGLENPHKLRLT